MNRRFTFPLTLLILATLMVSFITHFSGPQLLSVELLPLTSDRTEEQIVVRFSRPMKSDVFAEYWSLEPGIAGRMNWSDGALYFTPQETLPSGTNITIRVKAGAPDIYGRTLSKDTSKILRLPEARFVYVNSDGQLTQGSVNGEQKVLTSNKIIRQFVIDGKNEVVWYLHQAQESSPTELWRIELASGANTRWLQDKNFQIRTISVAKQGEELILLTQPILAQTNEALSVYRLPLSDKTLSQVELGELGLTLSALSVPGDGNTLVVTTLDGAQYLRTLVGDKMTTLSKLSSYRGSNRTGTFLVFEDIVPDKNYAGEVVLFNGGLTRITADESTLLMPTISPDGKHLAYSFQLRSALSEQRVEAGQELKVLFTLPVSGLRRQNVSDLTIEWEHYEPDASFELPKFSPDGHVLAAEVFSKDQLQDLSQIREYGEPNKPVMGKLRFFDRRGKLIPFELTGRELQWVDEPRIALIK